MTKFYTEAYCHLRRNHVARMILLHVARVNGGTAGKDMKSTNELYEEIRTMAEDHNRQRWSKNRVIVERENERLIAGKS